MTKLLANLILVAGISLAAFRVHAANWPAWRGPQHNGISTETRFPIEWSPTKNIRWKAALPDRGNSSPVVWGDQVFITQAIEKEHLRTVMCFSRVSGKVLWQKGVTYAELETTHEDNPYCAASPVTEGSRVIATFGSAGVFCYSSEGHELWRKDLGKQTHEWGYSSSPLILGDRCLVYHGPGPNSKLVALDKMNGQVLWSQSLPEPVPTVRYDGFKGNLPGRIGNFGTPVPIEVAGETQVVLGFPEQLKAIDPRSGAIIWFAGGLNPLVYTTPSWNEGVLVALGGFFGSGFALKPEGKGDLASKRLWYEQRAKKNRIGSPIIFRGHVYVLNMDGIAECLELATGKEVWTERLKGPGAKADSWSSFTLAGDRLYTVNQSGDAFVLRANPKFELLATNSVGEYSNSSFAHSQGDLFLRTYQHLWCIGGDAQTARQ